MKIKHGMVLAAGLGKRMHPLTLNKPKPLLEINDISLLERAINLLINCGVMEISINIHYLPDQIKKFLNEKKFNTQNEVCKFLKTDNNIIKKYRNSGKYFKGYLIRTT